MNENVNTFHKAGLPQRSIVYLRVKRTREDDALNNISPPILKIRLDRERKEEEEEEEEEEKKNSFISKEKKPSGDDPFSAFSLNEFGLDGMMCFRRLTKVESVIISPEKWESGQFQKQEKKDLMGDNNFTNITSNNINTKNDNSTIPTLSVERVWDLHGCVVMDCATVKKNKQEESIKDPNNNNNSDEGVKLEEKWSLYILDKNKQSEEEEEIEDAEMEVVDDEFAFDDLVITPNEEKEYVNILPEKNLKILNNKRKRTRDDVEVPEFIISSIPHTWSGKESLNEAQEITSIYDMLRDYGQDCFLLEENVGCEPELYLYPDHRKDDEYDSNAADFSGNEYPEEEFSTNTNSTEKSYYDEEDELRLHKSHQRGELWCEDDYTEASFLSSGWNSS